MYVCVACVPGAHECLKTASDCLELELQMVVSRYVGGRNQTRSSCKSSKCFNCGANCEAWLLGGVLLPEPCTCPVRQALYLWATTTAPMFWMHTVCMSTTCHFVNVLISLLTWFKLESLGERKTQLRNCLCQTGLWACQWSIFFIVNWCSKAQPLVST